MTYRWSSSTMIPSLQKKNDLWHIVRKDLFRGCSMLLQQKAPIKRDYQLVYEEVSKESLLAASKVSHARKASKNPNQVPRGSLAIYVGPELRRYVIPATVLSVLEFRDLMERVADEFGFEQEGGLKIPCEEEYFEEILLKCLATHRKMKKGK